MIFPPWVMLYFLYSQVNVSNYQICFAVFLIKAWIQSDTRGVFWNIPINLLLKLSGNIKVSQYEYIPPIKSLCIVWSYSFFHCSLWQVLHFSPVSQSWLADLPQGPAFWMHQFRLLWVNTSCKASTQSLAGGSTDYSATETNTKLIYVANRL